MLLNVFISIGPEFACTEMDEYIDGSKKSQRLCTTNWFPGDEGTCIFVKGGWSRDSSHECEHEKEDSVDGIYKPIGNLNLNN